MPDARVGRHRGAVEDPDITDGLGLDSLMATETPILEIALRLCLALLFSIGVGYERETADKPAGLRTHMLVALASCAFTIISLEMVASLETELTNVAADPVRVIEAIVTGVAFLGAGAIIQSRGNVVGITTGASIWLAGAIGLACGSGYYVVAALILVLALITLRVLGAFERRVLKKQATKRPGSE
jgi:putative Mg2+ transporter-C (MgtC) family protein